MNRNLIKGIDSWAALLGRYSESFLKWIREELEQIDQKTRKLGTMHKALHPRDDGDGLFVSRKEEGRRLTSTEDSIGVSIQRLEVYIEKRGRILITATRNRIDDTRTNRTTTTRKQKWKEKQLYGRFERLISNISQEKIWTWLRKGKLKRETESLLKAAQNKAIRINHMKSRVHKTK